MHRQIDDPNSLEYFYVKNDLLLINNLQSWIKEEPDKPFELILIQHHGAINESHWMDAVANAQHGTNSGLAAIPYPFLPAYGIGEAALSNTAVRLFEQEHCVVLEDGPVIVAGCLNHLKLKQVQTEVALAYPDRHHVVAPISPRAFAHFGAKIQTRTTKLPLGAWNRQDLKEWCELLGFSPETFLSTEEIVAELLHLKPSILPVSPYQIDRAHRIGNELALLLARTATRAWVAAPNPLDTAMIERVQQVLGLAIVPCLVAPFDLRRVLARNQAVENKVQIQQSRPLHIADWKFPLSADPSQLVDQILQSAITLTATDVHFEPKAETVLVRFRINKNLISQPAVSPAHYQLIIKRIKMLGGMKHDQKGLIEDGSMTRTYDGIRYDFRFVAIPSRYEDSIVCRIFGSRQPLLGELGLQPRELGVLRWFCKMNGGMLITCGETTSGKTTTLYALLHDLRDSNKKIYTIEQPIEKHFDGAVQIQVDPQGPLTFGAILRAIMRGDPNIIMVSEIRDADSADAAINCTLSGHKVFTTLHAEDCAGTMARLQSSFRIDYITLAQTIRLLISQRLVRQLCVCKREREPTGDELRPFPFIEIAEPVICDPIGCEACNHTGFSGLMPVMEMMPIDEGMATLISSGARADTLRQANLDRGYSNLERQACELFQTGKICMEDALKFVQTNRLSALRD